MKTCSKCKDEKLLSQFYDNRSSPDKKHSRCKACFKEANKEYYDKVVATDQEKVLRYRQKRKENIISKYLLSH